MALAWPALFGESSRPRRVKPAPKPTEEPLLRPERATTTTARTDPNAPLITVQPVRPVANTVASGDTANAYQLLQQKQFAAAAKEAKAVAANFPNDPEAWNCRFRQESNNTQSASDLRRR